MFLTYTFFVEFASPFIELHLSFFKSYHSVFLDSLNLVVRKRSFHSQCEFLLNKMWLTPKKFLRVGEFRSESFSDLLALISWILINQLITYPDYWNYQLVKIFLEFGERNFSLEMCLTVANSKNASGVASVYFLVKTKTRDVNFDRFSRFFNDKKSDGLVWVQVQPMSHILIQ